MRYPPGAQVWVSFNDVWYRAVVVEVARERMRAMAELPGMALTRAVAVKLVEGFDHHKVEMGQDFDLVIPEPTSDMVMPYVEVTS